MLLIFRKLCTTDFQFKWARFCFYSYICWCFCFSLASFMHSLWTVLIFVMQTKECWGCTLHKRKKEKRRANSSLQEKKVLVWNCGVGENSIFYDFFKFYFFNFFNQANNSGHKRKTQKKPKMHHISVALQQVPYVHEQYSKSWSSRTSEGHIQRSVPGTQCSELLSWEGKSELHGVNIAL